ncbi:B3 domain-containing protein Os01g0723500-like [Rosa rugosa]|uniref:B3 domain-containing protein Os01g0723500-like n=1 Tax=Rosa rugosa TaxID=74645 RepID=UPI002B41783C|nr:B3 domain-containing protein Os01g0723500-like [Rosa rugosa]XP_062023518.1 B3 domain-containing protein Os01g0723500-like [Rosa rugosa]
MEGASKEPTFFKIIKTGFNTDDLRIPPKFRRHMLNELSETATLELKGSSKGSWTVQVSQIESDIYFKNGWQKFIKDNSLGDFEFLVFRYERPMHFTIEIFDKTACKRNNLVEKSTRADNTKRPRGRPRKCNRSAAGENIQSCQSFELKEIKEEEEEEAATLPSSGFRSFTSIMGKHCYNVAVPVDFSREHLPQGYYNIVLKNLKGQKWKVKVVCSGKTVKLSAGWVEFRRANQINCGDICTFDLVGRRTMVVHVIPK